MKHVTPRAASVRLLLLAHLFALLALAGLPIAATSQVALYPDDLERVDVIAIERDDREVFAFDARTGGRVTVRLEVGEEIVFQETRGRVGVVLTDRRALGVFSGGRWVEVRRSAQEELATTALLGDRVAILVTNRRALALTSGAGWIEEGFTPSESAAALRAGAAVAVIATNRRALGVSPNLGRFVAQDVNAKEVLESISADDALVTLRTDRRILVFSGLRGRWSEQRRRVR